MARVVSTQVQQEGPGIRTIENVQRVVPEEGDKAKTTIFKTNQVVWYILGVVEVLLFFRLILRGLGANAASGFVRFVYDVSLPFAAPFLGIFRSASSGPAVIEWSTIVAMLVYLVVAWGVVELMNLAWPVKPSDVESDSTTV